MEKNEMMRTMSLQEQLETNGGVIPLALMAAIWGVQTGIYCGLLGIAADRAK